MNKVLFLGYDEKKNRLIPTLRKNRKLIVDHKNEIVSLNQVEKYDLVVCYGYRIKINREIVEKYKKIFNLHISYLPYNRGSHPNFWSFIENTPSGVSIHKIDNGIDTGNIIFQKLIDFNLIKNKKTLTFANTYNKLIFEVEELFLQNFNKILNDEYKEQKQHNIGRFHRLKDLPPNLKSWDQNIYDTICQYNNLKIKNI
jgi:methionyl-tRNA formyltransferase